MIVFGSRGSDLALTQTHAVAEALARSTGCPWRVEVIETRGDRILDRPLPQIGGKGLFTQELEDALRQGRIDVAVHSMKDLPVADPDGLIIGAVPERRDAGDVLVCQRAWHDPAAGPVPLRAGCRVGTSSLRRRAALERARHDLTFADVRGNVPTRVDKVRRGDYGAVVLAAAGLDRLGLPLGELVRAPLPVDLCPPAPAQGALAVQCRRDDERVRALLARLHDSLAEHCARAERTVLQLLGGGCSMPLGVLVAPAERGFRLRAAYFAPGAAGAPPAAVFADCTGDEPIALAERTAALWQPLVGRPLAGQDLVLVRPEGGSSELDEALTIAGANVRRLALTRVVPLAVSLTPKVAEATLAFTSTRAVELFAHAARAAGIDLRGRTAFAGGPATARAVAAEGMHAIAPSAGGGGKALAECIAAARQRPQSVLFPCAADRHPDLEQGLRAAGIAVTALPLYRTEELPGTDSLPGTDALPGAAADVPAGATVVLTSPSAARAFAQRPGPGARLVAIGATTAAAMTTAGLSVFAVAAEPTAAAIVRCCQESSRA